MNVKQWQKAVKTFTAGDCGVIDGYPQYPKVGYVLNAF